MAEAVEVQRPVRWPFAASIAALSHQAETSSTAEPALPSWHAEGVNHGPPELQRQEGARFVLVMKGDIAKWNVSNRPSEMVRARRGSRIPSLGLQP